MLKASDAVTLPSWFQSAATKSETCRAVATPVVLKPAEVVYKPLPAAMFKALMASLSPIWVDF